jgi:hypothetical protein
VTAVVNDRDVTEHDSDVEGVFWIALRSTPGGVRGRITWTLDVQSRVEERFDLSTLEGAIALLETWWTRCAARLTER